MLDGYYIGDYCLSDEEVDSKLRINPAYIDASEAILSIPVWEHPAGPVHLGNLVHLVVKIQSGELERCSSQRWLAITANIRFGAPISSLTPGPQPAIKQLYAEVHNRFASTTLAFGGEVRGATALLQRPDPGLQTGSIANLNTTYLALIRALRKAQAKPGLGGGLLWRSWMILGWT